MKNNKLGFIFTGIFLFWSLAILFVTLGSAPFNPLSLNHESRINVYTLLPQGWGFFTRSPREPVQTIYVKSGNKWELISKNAAHTSNFLGASRMGRYQSAELIKLTSQVKEEQWIKCDRSFEQCADLYPIAIEVVNSMPVPTVLGEIVIKSQPPVPWAWSKSNVEMPFNIIKLNVVRPKTTHEKN